MTLFIDVKKVSERYGFSVPTAWRLAKSGNFPAPFKLSEGCTRWRLSDLEKWESEQAAKTQSGGQK